jgi:hypothetical protein
MSFRLTTDSYLGGVMKLNNLCIFLEVEFGEQFQREDRSNGSSYYWQEIKKAPKSTRLLRLSESATGDVAEIKLAQSSIAAGRDVLLSLPTFPEQVAAAVRSELSRLQKAGPSQSEIPGVILYEVGMDPRVARLCSVDDCESFSVNARERGAPELAAQARKRAVQLRAGSHGAKTEVERECLQAVYAYEEILSAQKGKRQPASRTWQMIKRHGIIPAVERVVTKREVSSGFTALAEMGLMDYAFEVVILRHPDVFSVEAVAISKQRIGLRY